MTNALLITQTHNLWKKDGSASVQPGHVLKLPDLHIMKSNTDYVTTARRFLQASPT